MWVLVFYAHLFAIYAHNDDYKVVVDGHKKFFRGANAREELKQFLKEEHWAVWVRLCELRADW